jgi:hypothetical protein
MLLQAPLAFNYRPMDICLYGLDYGLGMSKSFLENYC